MPEREAVELFLQEASEHLQYLREYVSVLQEISPRREDLERLYIAAHTLSGTSASYGFPRFSEIAGKLAHVFQYSLNATLGDDLHGPLTEFLSDGISLLETDLLEISDTGKENVEDIASFKERYRFAFPVEPVAVDFERHRPDESTIADSAPAGVTGSYFDALPLDDEVGPEILDFFQPEAEEHLQVVSDCLISLEGNNNPEEINRLFRAIHTVKGSAAQVGLKRLGAIAHRVEDLIGRLRDGEIEPSPAVVDLCLEDPSTYSRKTLHQQWADESEMRNAVDSLLNRIAEFAPVEIEEAAAEAFVASNSYEQPLRGNELAAPTHARKAVKQPAAPGPSRKIRPRIALERLDRRMMNTVGESFRHQPHPHGRSRIRTRKTRRYPQLLEKERLQGKVNEFQEKYGVQPASARRARSRPGKPPQLPSASPAPPPATACSTTSANPRDGSLRRLQHPLALHGRNFRRRQRSPHAPSSKATSAASKRATSTNSPNSRTTCRTNLPPPVWCPSAPFTLACLARSGDAAQSGRQGRRSQFRRQ